MADHSRVVRLGSVITGRPETELEARLERASVSVGLDLAVPGVELAADTLLRMLRRMPGMVVLDPTNLERRAVDRFVERAAEIDPTRPIAVRPARESDSRIHLAGRAPDGDARGLPEQHGYLLDTRGPALRQRAGASALGSILCACALAAEAFKSAAAVVEPRGRRSPRTAFCPVTLTSDPALAPPLPERWEVRAMLLGLGAIGTGSALVLSEMPIEGEVDLVDPQRYGDENAATYSLGGAEEASAHPWKTSVVARALPRFTTRAHHCFASQLPALIDRGELAWPPILLTGLDKPQARREAQRVWPDILIDGATGDTMVGIHVVHGPGQPCVDCFFPERQVAGPPAAADLSDLTGLPRELLVQGEHILSEADLVGVSPAHRTQLASQVGKPVCGLASALGLTALPDEGYQPAVPFVALSASALVVARLVAQSTGVEPAANFVQYDALVGPICRTVEVRQPRGSCDCVTHATIVRRVRDLRGGMRRA